MYSGNMVCFRHVYNLHRSDNKYDDEYDDNNNNVIIIIIIIIIIITQGSTL
jgi:hypothetical protein